MCVHCYVYCSEICHIPFTDVSAANVNRMMFKHVGFSSYFLFVSGTKCIPFQTNLTVQSSSPTLHTENKSTTTLTEPAVLNNFRLKSISGKILKLCCVLHLLKIPEANESGTKKKNTIIKNKSKASYSSFTTFTCFPGTAYQRTNLCCALSKWYLPNQYSKLHIFKKKNQTLRRQQAASFLVIGYILFYIQ